MSRNISVPLPLNISAEESHLYEPYRSYEFPAQKIRYFKNVFITPSGFCINKKGLIRECHHAYPQQYDSYLTEAAVYYKEATDNPDRLITLDAATTWLSIHHPWYNYYHWICESIFRLWMARDILDRVTLILPEYYRDAAFIMDSLEPFAIRRIYFIPPGKCLLAPNLCLPQIKPLCDSYNARHLNQVRRFYRDYVLAKHKAEVPGIERLYISRRMAGRRAVVNSDEIEPVLLKYGFTIWHPEKHPFLEQVTIFTGVRWLIGEHGSGLTNMLFMEKDTSVLELHKDKTNELDHPSFLFWYLAAALGINYYHQSCTTHGREDYFEGDYIIDPQLLERNIERLLSAPQ